MRALVKTARGVGRLALRDRPEPVPIPGWVTIAVRYAGICGTDVHIVADEFPYWPPVTLGHEFVGTVVRLGDGVDPAWLGARVVSEPHSLACGTCHLCRRGFAELCASKRSPGWGIDGAFASQLAMPAHLLHRVPDGVSDLAAALAEPMAVSVSALARAGVDAGDTVLIVGPGPVGILLAAAARVMGAATVVVAGRHDSDRLRFVASVGARTAVGDAALELVRDHTAGRGADLVVDATGSAEAIALALGAVRRRGRLVAVGMSGQPMVPVPWDLAISRAVDATFSMSSNATAWDPALMILERTPQLAAMTTVFPLGGWQAAFMAVKERTVIKALLDPAPRAER
jgi:L-iditol 2-dehydrogenase